MKDLIKGGDGQGGYDLIVLGAGSAGFSAAITGADAGKRVALVGHGTIGGTCVNVGCVPSKAMIRGAEAVHGATAAKRFPGLSGQAQVDDWRTLVQSKDDLVANLRQKKYADLLPEYEGVDYIDAGPARLVEGGVTVGQRTLTAPKTIIATGGRPVLPTIDGIEDIGALDSTSAELAQMMSRMGVKVTLVARSHVLPGAESEVSEALAEAFVAEGITLLTGLSYDTVRRDGAGVTLRVIQGGKPVEVTADHLVSTAGRRANTEDMGLDAIGVETNVRGSIVVGEDMQTSVPGIYAAGDVTDRDQFVYMAAYGAKLAAKNAVLGENHRYDNAAMPWVVFSDPQVAGAGLSEAQARDAGFDVKTSIVPLDQVPRALAARDTRADTIQTLVMALKFGMTTKALGETIFPYLTTVEGLKLAAQTFDMDVAKLSCCAG